MRSHCLIHVTIEKYDIFYMKLIKKHGILNKLLNERARITIKREERKKK
jgi:hypothetical protein